MLATILALVPAAAPAQVFETDFDDLQGWTPAWPGDAWQVARGQAQPATDLTCTEALGAGGVCGFGGELDPVDNVLFAGDADWTGVRVTASFTNFDDDAVGFVVRHQDADNYYLVLLSRGTWPDATDPVVDRTGVTTRLYRVRAGRPALLASADTAYAQGAAQLIRIDAAGSRLTVFLDQNGDGALAPAEQIFTFDDPSPLLSGRVGLWAYDNRNFFVDWLRVFEVQPPPRPSGFRVTSIDRAGEQVVFRFDLDRVGTGYLLTGTGRCADIDPVFRQPDAGIGTRITGGLATAPDEDYCVRACGKSPDGTECGPEIDISTRGAIVDTRELSPGHWDLLTANGLEHLRSRPTGSRVSTTARMGTYQLVLDGRPLTFQVDHEARVSLPRDDFDGLATVNEGALVVRGLPVTLDPGRQPAETRWALFGEGFAASYGGFRGRDERQFRLLPGRYRWRVRGIDYAFDLAPDGSLSLPPASETGLRLVGNRLQAIAEQSGEAVAFRFTLTNGGARSLRAGGLFNGRGARPGDDNAVFSALRTYALEDADRADFENLAAALGFEMGAHAFYGFDRVLPGGNGQVDVLVTPSHPRVELIADVAGTFDHVAVAAEPHAVVLFGEDGEPTEGTIEVVELDTDGGDAGALSDRRVTATGQGYGTLRWQVLARSATPGPLTVHWLRPDGELARVSFSTNRAAQGAVQAFAGSCDEAIWSQSRETALGAGSDFTGDIALLPETEYCLRARVVNAAGTRYGPPTSLSTAQITVDATALAGQYRLQRVGVNEVRLIEAGGVRADLGLRMGSYLVDQGGAEIEVVVDKDGQVAYAPGLEGVLQGVGTGTLILAGVPLRIDNATLSGDPVLYAGRGGPNDLALGTVPGGEASAWRVLPGDFNLLHGERHRFSVGADGTIQVTDAASLGVNGGALAPRARALNLDLLPVPGQVGIGAAGANPVHLTLDGGARHPVGLLPGRYTLLVNGTISRFTVGAAGNTAFSAIDQELAFRSCADQGAFARGEGVGTDTLVVRADPCSITAEVECLDACGDTDDVFQLQQGRGEASGTVRYASGRPVRADENFEVTFEVDGGTLDPAVADTGDDGTAVVAYRAPDVRGSYRLRVRGAGFTSTKAFVVIPIRDFTPPRITPPAPIQLEQSNADGAPFRLPAPQVVDNVDPAPVLENDAPATFPLGRTVVTWRAVDFSGNAAIAFQEVTVVDTRPPVLRVPAEVVVEATTASGTRVPLNDVQAEDICDARPDITRDGPQRFVVGERLITWTATDDSGNSATAQTLVRVIDTTPPRILFGVDEIVIEATHANGARSVDLPLPVVTDNGDRRPTLTHNAPGSLPYGVTPVTFTATDRSGNVATARINVRVVDRTAPTITIDGVPDGWARRADLSIRVFDLGDESPELFIEPAPDGTTRDAERTVAAYTTEGTYDVAVSAIDDTGNQTTRVLRTFGIDHTNPRIRLRTSLPAEGQPGDPRTWPIVFTVEQIQLDLDATDAPAAAVSGIAHVRVVLDPGTEDEVVLAEEAPALAGAPVLSGPPALRNVRCTDALLCAADGGIYAGRLGGGRHVLRIEARDAAGNTVTEERRFRTFTLAAALREARDLVRDEAGMPGLANEALEALAEAADRLDAAATLAEGQPAGVDAPVDLTGTILRGVQRVGPVLDRARRFGAEVDAPEALYGRALYWAVAAFGQLGEDPEIGNAEDYDAAINDHLALAAEQLAFGEVDAALASLVDAYFLFENALRPLSTERFGRAVDSIAEVRDQIGAYIQDGGRPGADVLEDAHTDLVRVADDLAAYLRIAGEHEDEEEQLLALARVPAHDYVQTLLALQRAALELQSAGQADVWIRNWGWGLVQVVMYLADLGLKRSLAIEPDPVHPRDEALLRRAAELTEEGMALVAARRIDRFIQLFLEPETTCVIVGVYNRSFDPQIPSPQGCNP